MPGTLLELEIIYPQQRRAELLLRFGQLDSPAQYFFLSTIQFLFPHIEERIYLDSFYFSPDIPSHATD